MKLRSTPEMFTSREMSVTLTCQELTAAGMELYKGFLGDKVALGRVCAPVLRSSTIMILKTSLWSWGRVDLYQIWYQEYFLGGQGSRCVRLTNIITLICQLSKNLGAWTSWNLQGPGPVQACAGIALLLHLQLPALIHGSQIGGGGGVSRGKSTSCYRNNLVDIT
jgi:hypothetical protein